MTTIYDILKGNKMINIKLEPYNISLKIVLFLLILIFIFISTSKIAFSKELKNNIQKINSPEEELAIKFCDAINKNLFNGLNKETSLKYEYYFSSLRIQSRMDPEIFFKDFRLNVKRNCNYILTEWEKNEFISYLEKSLNQTSERY